MSLETEDLLRDLSQNAESVCRHYLPAGRREGSYWMVGDLQNNPGRSLFVRLTGPTSGPGARGKWTDSATSEFGDLLDIIRERTGITRFPDLLAEARVHLGRPQPVLPDANSPRSRKSPSGTPAAAARLFAASLPLAGSLAEAYLRTRGITQAVPSSSLRFHPKCWHRDEGQTKPVPRPAMIAAVTDRAGAFQGLHRTWLEPDGQDKAAVDTPRRAMGHLLGNAVRIAPADQTLVLGEGIETMLSVREAAPSLPVWAALSSGHLGAVLLPVGSRPIGVAEAVLGEINFLRPQQGRVKADGSSSLKRGFSFSTRASQLWRFSLGSNAAVLKKIGKGGTANAKELAAQMDYLFSKSASIFGNGVVLDADANGLTKDERNDIVGDWVEDWRGSPKNGHTTHLLMSFPSHVRPEKAKLIAEAWAFEMFQSGEHQDDVWSYVAALHTDKAHPHVHMVINNRGTVNDSWFFMAKEHAFNLNVMKARMVEIAAEEGVFLDATSRAERGLLTYGPSRAEIERARVEGRAPEERPREGKALEDALATMTRTADAMRSLSHVATLTGLPEIGEKIAKAEETLRRGGVLQPFPSDIATVERADLDRHFSGWMAEAEGKIRKMPFAERKEMRDELYGYATDIAKGLGDVRGAQLLQMLPQTKLYATGLEGDRLTQSREVFDLQPGAVDRLKKDIASKAVALGLSADRMAERLETGAANAWEERDWVRSDLLALSGRRRADLRVPEKSRKVVDDLEGFYEAAAKLMDHARTHEAVYENDRLLRALGSMGRIMQADGKVEFRGDAHAERFADELRRRYGKGVVAQLASGRTDALAADLEDADQRKWIARAVVSAAKSHVAFGLTLHEAREAERVLVSQPERSVGKDWEQ